MLGPVANSVGAVGLALLAQAVCTSQLKISKLGTPAQVVLFGVLFGAYSVVVYETGRKSSDMLAVAILAVMAGLVPVTISGLSNVRRPKLGNDDELLASWTISDAAKVVAFTSGWLVVAIEVIWHNWTDANTLNLTAPIAATLFAAAETILLSYTVVQKPGTNAPRQQTPQNSPALADFAMHF